MEIYEIMMGNELMLPKKSRFPLRVTGTSLYSDARFRTVTLTDGTRVFQARHEDLQPIEIDESYLSRKKFTHMRIGDGDMYRKYIDSSRHLIEYSVGDGKFIIYNGKIPIYSEYIRFIHQMQNAMIKNDVWCTEITNL